MYQVEHTREKQNVSSITPPHMGFLQGMLCWPGLLVQTAMVVMLLLESGDSTWGQEIRKQVVSPVYTRLYSGIFWLFLSGFAGTVLVA